MVLAIPERLFVTTHHDGEGRVASPDISAGNRGVQAGHAPFRRDHGDLFRERRPELVVMSTKTAPVEQPAKTPIRSQDDIA